MEAQMEPSSTGYAVVLLGLGLGLGVLTIRVRYQQKIEERNAAGGEMVVTKEFKSFQATFMTVYLGALLTEWFQAAYLFVLLRKYHPEQFVVRMYLAGVVSQLSLATLLEVMGGFVSHKLRCAACLALQAGSAIFMVHPAFGGLVMSRVLGGFAAALLHSSFEAWMVEQHVSQGFPLDWFTHTFNQLSVAMSVLAIAMAPAVTTAHDLAGGALGPFKMSLLLTALNACLLFSWRRDSNKACPGCSDVARLGSHAWTAVLGGGNAALIIAAQGCFEAATFAFALLWTPLLAAFYVEMELPQPPWGIVFSQQLACVMIGSVLFKLSMSLAPSITAERLCLWASTGGACCFLAIAVNPPLSVVQSALLGFEVCVGVYLNAMGVMRNKYIPQEARGLVVALSKLVITTCLFGLLVFCSESRGIATGMCGALLTTAAVCCRRAAAGSSADTLAGGGNRATDGDSDDDEFSTLTAQQKR